jgi:hypothetical protein
MSPSEEKCKYCEDQASQFLFAQHVCEKEDCIAKARDERGGPGGHMLDRPRHGSPTVESMDFDEELD